MNRARDKNKFVAEVFYTNFSKTGYCIQGTPFIPFHIGCIYILTRVLLTWLEQLNDIGYDHQLTREDSLVTWLCIVDDVSTEDDID